MTRTTPGDGRDCLYLASGLSLAMAAGCVFLAVASPNPPGGEGQAIPLAAILESTNLNFWIFLIVSLVVAGLMQFYFLGTAQFMQDSGISSKHVPGSMALAQIAQALATLFLFGRFMENFGFQWTLTIGAACWAALYLLYVVGQPRALLIVSQPLHGFAYVFFIIVGQVFTNEVAPESVRMLDAGIDFRGHDRRGAVSGYSVRRHHHGYVQAGRPFPVAKDLACACPDYFGRRGDPDCPVPRSASTSRSGNGLRSDGGSRKPEMTSLCDVALALLRWDPHELASWVNQIDGYNARCVLLQDPRESPRG